jgi:hypothetical protein
MVLSNNNTKAEDVQVLKADAKDLVELVNQVRQSTCARLSKSYISLIKNLPWVLCNIFLGIDDHWDVNRQEGVSRTNTPRMPAFNALLL